MAKKRIKSTAKMARGYEPGDFTFERSSRLGAVRGGEGTTTVVRVGGDSSPDAPAPALGSLASEDDAPFDGVAYERKDGAWVAAGSGSGVSDGDKGDITVSASGATWTIDAQAVSASKMTLAAADRLLGRDTAGAGVAEELTVGGGLEFTGSGGIQRSALTGDVTATAGSGSTTIANNAVTFAKMQDLSASVLMGAETAGDPVELTVTFPLAIKAGALIRYAIGSVEVDLGSLAAFRGRFTIVDTEISPSRVVQCWQAPGPYTGKGTRADESEMQAVQVIAVSPGSGSATVYWQTPPAYTMQDIIPDGRRDAPSTAAGFDPRYPYVQSLARRKGLVRGNVKFHYSIG